MRMFVIIMATALIFASFCNSAWAAGPKMIIGHHNPINLHDNHQNDHKKPKKDHDNYGDNKKDPIEFEDPPLPRPPDPDEYPPPEDYY